ncbi:hypothetical protein LTR95_001651, partial [Oleoguttula sp. CCFEE 5521]
MRHARVSRSSAAISCGKSLEGKENPLCALCQESGVWEHLTAQRILTARDWILGFIASPEDVDDAERQACPFCSMVFSLLPTNAFAPEHIAQYHRNIKYCNVQPRAVRIGRKAVFTSYRVVYNYCEYVSHTAKVYQAHRGQLALDSTDRRECNVQGVSPVQLGATLDIKTAKKWLRLCQAGHSACSSLAGSRTGSRLDIILIDVTAGCLVDASTLDTYVCLSYVWGQVPGLQTYGSNVDALRKHGSLFERETWTDLTTVVQDFIRTVQQLEVQYAWVDCLCIIQDDEESKRAQIIAMDLIYSEALLTIVQLSGQDANDGLAGARHSTRADCALPVIDSSPGTNKDSRLMLTELPRWTHISRDESTYKSRGWTLQEELLSTRCLYLSNWGAFWQCRATRFSDTHSGDLVMDVSASDLASFIPQLPDSSIVGAKQTDAEQILHWAVRAEWYSGRKLTYEDDRGRAFQGILSDLGQSQSRNFLWGHPDDHTLPLSLLW